MSRPADHRWQVLGESGDPVPGDVHDLQALSRRFEATAKTITDTTEALRRLGNLESWDSEAGKAFAEKANDTAKTVSKAHDRYAGAATALKTYYTDLETIQEDADKLLRDAETKSGDLTTARSGADNPPKGTTEGDQKKLDKKVTVLQEGLDDLRGKLAAVKTRHKEAGDKAAKAIHDTTEGDGLNDGWLDDLRDSLKIISDISGAIAAFCGIAALAVGWIPIIGQALAGVLGTVALVMTVVSLVCHVLLAINGDGSWGDVAMDVLGLATFGIGRVFGAGAKLAATASRSRVWNAARQYVRAWNPGMNSRATRALVESMVGPRAGAVDDVVLPNVSLAAAFKGLPRSFADDMSTVTSRIGDLFKGSDNMAALRNAYNTAGPRGVASMYVGPGMVDELGRMKNIGATDLALIGTPDAFKQALTYNSIGLGGTAVGAGSDLNSFIGLFTEGPEPDVTGSDASLAGR
ncbi:hypothetical protein GCM10023084_33870 [Streptomyces lacrimifluminis]|uniref:Uncharacterized protein n=1 Tax=Streptomyces lacrimifluminis TaxID=1500077 RepID=A0A917KWB2_9ACTN|nr:hypothetical protein [Streptomyces lacrimifluminis]GGJ31247.1 hypothetical protein GCM10012282_29820 [Streptomyces lacrimifluminis]